MELSDIEPAFIDLKEHIEAQDVRIDFWEERLLALGQDMNRIKAKIEDIEHMFGIAVRDR
ncbi:hypothetical protein KAR91_29730 [Candidatus Pacearchaeota archaeon]|nr:hypothetical protein [Candidatus Pacearchaeota archaeon]